VRCYCQTEAHRCKWAATVNWKGSVGHNIGIDLFQENRNCEMKKLIRSMGANKTAKAIERASKACGGVWEIVEAFENQVNIRPKSGSHTHKSSTDDEKLISRDLRGLRPLKKEEGRSFETFVGISHEPTHSLDKVKFKEWIDRHKKHYAALSRGSRRILSVNIIQKFERTYSYMYIYI
jgi:hypothetical protein